MWSPLITSFAGTSTQTAGVIVVRRENDLPEEYGFILDRVGAGFKTRASNVVRHANLIDLPSDENGSAGHPLFKNSWDFGRAQLI